MQKDNIETLLVKVSELTGSRLVGLEDFECMLSFIIQNTQIEPAEFVMGFITGRAIVMNLSLHEDYETLKVEADSVFSQIISALKEMKEMQSAN